MTRIPVAGPWITEKEVQYAADAAAHGWYSQAGVYPTRFEHAFAQHVGRAHAIALPSCTSALHLILLGLGIGPGDEVIVPDTTWIGSSAPISYVGATPVFADVDPGTWCLTGDAMRVCMTDRTRAVIPVDLYGGMPEMDTICALAAERGVAVIEDAAEAIGSEYRGVRAGAFGVASTFSLHGSKTLTCGEGGVLVLDDPDLYERIEFLRDHGRGKGDKSFRNLEVAHKYRMSAIQAALALAQLERVAELVGRKREIFGWYAARLGEVAGLRLNCEPEDTRNAYWMVTCLWDASLGVTKDEVIRELGSCEIDSRPFFNPLSSLPAYENLPTSARARAENRVSYALSPVGINLPSALCLTESDVDRVCTTFLQVLGLSRS
jgi:perosamine synthetase